MYSTNRQYHPIPTDTECPPSPCTEHQQDTYDPTPYYDHVRPKCPFLRSFALERTLLYRIIAFTFIILACITYIICRVAAPLIGPDFMFNITPKPRYLDAVTSVDRSPLVVRLAIICRVDGFERRQAIRDSVLDGVPGADVTLEYRFFVGRVRDAIEDTEEGRRIVRRIERENEVHGDVVVLSDVEDVPERISEKRFAALRWANSVPYQDYDYAMTMDSDTFCRFRTLARRIRHFYADLRPREEAVLIGRMATHNVYWQNTVIDDKTANYKVKEDVWVKGPTYPYPIGIGYMLSSHLTATLLSAAPALPHHIHYPYDDVMIGSWIAGLKQLHDDPSSLFQQSEPPHESVHPSPYLPYAVNTTIVDDKTGWHDYKRRGSVAHAIGWETACVHRMAPAEMRMFRGMEEVRMEWDY